MDETETFAVAGLAAPHALAAAAGRDVLVEGGSVVEAAIAAAAVSAVVVPARNGLGGDALWLIREPGPRGRTRVLDGRGTVAAAARLSFYRERGFEAVPRHGAEAVAAAPGAVAAWAEAHAFSAATGGRLPLSRLLAPAAAAARQGWDLSVRDAEALSAAAPVLSAVPGFAPAFAPAFLADGKAPEAGSRSGNVALAATLDHLGAAGLDDAYRGDVGRELAVDLAALSSPLGRADLRAVEVRWRDALDLDLGRHDLTVPPTRSGLWAAVALGLFAGLGADGFAAEKRDGFPHWHGTVESLRAAAAMIDAEDAGGRDPAGLLDAERLAWASLALDRERARRVAPPVASPLDEAAVWIGVVDRDGAAVSLVQTLGGAYGSGVVSGRTGILMGNRAAALAIDPDLGPVLRPGRRVPLRSLPALATSPRDGRVAALGAEGDGAPVLLVQLAALLLRGDGLGPAAAMPRVALGAVPGEGDAAVLFDDERPPGPVARLRSAGHAMVPVAASGIGACGAVLREPTGRVAAAWDDGAVSGI